MDKSAAVELADRAIDGALEFAAYDSGLIQLPGRPSVWGAASDGYEATARLALLAAARIGGCVTDQLPSPDWTDRIVSLIAAGAGPSGGWPTVAQSAQAVIEDANVAKAMLVSDGALWDHLPANTQERLIDRFEADLTTTHVQDNWILCAAVSAAFLQSIGRATPTTISTIDLAFARTDDWYLGDGWYADGPLGHPDYYSAWGFNHELVLIARAIGDDERLAGRSSGYDKCATRSIH